MRVTIAHNRGKETAKQAVSQAVEQVLTGLNVGPLTFTDQRRDWSGDTLKFSARAKMGFLSTPIAGWALVSDRDITLDLDLGLLGKLIPEDTARKSIEGSFKALLT